MGQPASRVGDFHVCPLVSALVPHVGGPVLPPGAPTVLIGGLPAAGVGDQCLCVGPPDVITSGAFTVLISGKPGARMGSLTAHGGTLMLGLPNVLLGEGLSAIAQFVSPEVMALIIQSPTLVANLIALSESGWTFQSGEAGKGSFARRSTKTIVLDPNATDPADITQTLAHESGHALYEMDPYVPPDGLSREEFVERNTQRNLKDEGEATLVNAEVRREIQNTSGTDIGLAGTQTEQYNTAYEQYREHGDRDRARNEIGNVFGHGEHPSTEPGVDYAQYYGRPYENTYDNL